MTSIDKKILAYINLDGVVKGQYHSELQMVSLIGHFE